MIIERCVCDRCGKEFKLNLNRTIKYGVDITKFDESNERKLDLCQECIDDLQRWFFIKPIFKKTAIEYYLGTQKYKYYLEVNADGSSN